MCRDIEGNGDGRVNPFSSGLKKKIGREREVKGAMGLSWWKGLQKTCQESPCKKQPELISAQYGLLQILQTCFQVVAHYFNISPQILLKYIARHRYIIGRPAIRC